MNEDNYIFNHDEISKQIKRIKSMSKPIFVVRLPLYTSQDELRRVLDGLEGHPISQDYHILSFIGSDGAQDDVLFECYNSPHTEIEFNELKELILSNIKNK